MNEILVKRRRSPTELDGATHVRGTDVFDDLKIGNSGVERQKVRLAIEINKALLEMGTTQIERAQALGVAQPVVSNLERFELAGMSMDRLMRYAEQLGLVFEIKFSDGVNTVAPIDR